MLQWISTKYVVLWDEEEKKGWLINGTSALLHLVRTSLKHYSEDDFSSAFLFDASKMEDQMDHKPNSAVRVLISDQNRDLEIYLGSRERFDQEESTQTDGSGGDIKSTRKRGYFLFEDLVKQHLNNLEQIIDYQRRSATQDGVKVKMRVRKHLEGWDFAELATDHDPYARVATLQAMGYGWVDFVRSIGAVVLFGRGFGEIIRPAQCGSEMCLDWKSLPSHRYYLAVSMADLSKIMSKHGDPAASPPRPVHELLWHSPNGVLSACSCLSRDGWGGSGRHTCPSLLPSNLRTGAALALAGAREARALRRRRLWPQCLMAVSLDGGRRRHLGERGAFPLVIHHHHHHHHHGLLVCL